MAKYDTTQGEVDLHFQYPIHDSAVLDEMKDIIALSLLPDVNEMQKVKDIVGYAHRLFEHDGTNTPTANDPLTILKEAIKGNSFRCRI